MAYDLSRRWLAETRYYYAHLGQDLLADRVLTRMWGGGFRTRWFEAKRDDFSGGGWGGACSIGEGQSQARVLPSNCG